MSTSTPHLRNTRPGWFAGLDEHILWEKKDAVDNSDSMRKHAAPLRCVPQRSYMYQDYFRKLSNEAYYTAKANDVINSHVIEDSDPKLKPDQDDMLVPSDTHKGQGIGNVSNSEREHHYDNEDEDSNDENLTLCEFDAQEELALATSERASSAVLTPESSCVDTAWSPLQKQENRSPFHWIQQNRYNGDECRTRFVNMVTNEP